MCRLLCLLIVSSVLLGAVPVSAADDPLSVVQAFIDARNGGDLAAASPLMADTTASVGGPGCPVASPCVGAAAHQSELEGFAALHAQVTLVAPRVSGTTVEGRMEGRNDLTRAAGVDRTVSDLTADVQDGQITTWRVIPDPNDPQNQAVQAYQAAAAGRLSVVQAFIEARNRGDIDAAMAVVGPTVRYVDGLVCTPESPCVGINTVQRDLELFVADQVSSTVVGGAEVSGTLVRARLLSVSPEQLAIGVDRTLSDVTAEVADGQLITWQSVSDATDPQTAWWLAHQP